jgi:hypothetical protein
MMLHAASLIAFFLDSVQQAPVVLQCVQSQCESWVKWLLPTLVQTVVSLLSIFAGVGIAVRSFRANKKSEHEQWVRDQKKAEWRDLLDSVCDCQIHLPIAKTAENQLEDVGSLYLVADAKVKLLEVRQLLVNRLFIDRSILRPLHRSWSEVINKANESAMDQGDKTAMRLALMELNQLIDNLREAAKKDLGVQDGADEL